MPTIGVIGANGQVGSEVCLFLSQMEGVRVIPICRTELGSVLLRRCGLECRHGRIESPDEAPRPMAACDLVADFSLPKGVPSEVRATIKRITTNVVRHAPTHARLVYISSIMAFGMGSRSK